MNIIWEEGMGYLSYGWGEIDETLANMSMQYKRSLDECSILLQLSTWASFRGLSLCYRDPEPMRVAPAHFAC